MKKFLFLSFLIIFSALFGLVNTAEAGTGHNLTGWAWADPETVPSGDPPGTNLDIGWISFNCYNDYNGDGVLEDHCSGKDYGVNVDLSTGLFSGYAWSGGGDGTDPNQGIGWITFNTSELVGCPAAPCEARLNLSTNEVSGWARALANGGGWDGWIKLRGTIPGDSYGVSRDTIPDPDELTGWAWGGNDTSEEAVVGWISFNCSNQGVCAASNYKVFIRNIPPSATNLNVTQGNYCFSSSPPVFLNWTFDDPGNSQSAYRVQVATDSIFTSIVVDSGKVLSASNSYPPPGLSFNANYYWRVRVWDNQNLISDCGNPGGWCYSPNDPAIVPFPTPPPGNSFSTLPQLPWPDFTWTPPSPSTEEVVQFTDQSTCYDIDSTCNSWAWDFGDGTSCSGPPLAGSCGDSDFQNPTHIYTASSPPGGYSVTLTATDSNGSCEKTHDLTISPPLPEWREIPPTGFLQKLFAGILEILRSIV